MNKLFLVLAVFPLCAFADSQQISFREERAGFSHENMQHQNRDFSRDQNLRRDEDLNRYRRPVDVNVNQAPNEVYMPDYQQTVPQQPTYQQNNYNPPYGLTDSNL